MVECAKAYRKAGDAALHCTAVPDKRTDYCAHQFLCQKTGKWEVSPVGAHCPLKKQK